jgi:hemolysin III
MRRHPAGELEADFAVHLIGTITGAIGATALLALAAASANTAVFVSVLVYGIGLVAMLVFSAAYHLQRSSGRRDLLRRADHAAIFVMIAGTYTPFTVCTLNSSSAVWLAGPMWLAALGGAVLKLACPRWSGWASTIVYLAMGWVAVIFMQPLLAALDRHPDPASIGRRAVLRWSLYPWLAPAPIPRCNLARLGVGGRRASLHSDPLRCRPKPAMKRKSGAGGAPRRRESPVEEGFTQRVGD